MNRWLRASVFVLIGLGLGGCAGFRPEPWQLAPDRKAPHTEEVLYVHSIGFDRESARLQLDERARLDGFLDNAGVTTADEIRIGAVDGSGLSERREAVVAAFLRHRHSGIVVERTTSGDVAPNAVRVEVRRYLVRLPGCPDWTDRPGRTFSNTPTANWGCATAVNFGLMVAEPRDLIQGRQPDPLDGAYGALAIERYRAGEVRPLETDQSPTPVMTSGETAAGEAP